MLKFNENCLEASADEHRKVGKGVKFERIRRITGYLVGLVDRFNNAKRQELNDRIIHMGKNEGQLPPKI